jgi:peptidoglycan/LPS O-acetylase OafA/YrhL
MKTYTKIDCLTGLRFWASLWVLFFHSGASFLSTHGYPPFLVNFFTNGHLGVPLFFILSGWVLAYSNFKNQNQSTFSFYSKRLARIYPVYLVALLIQLPFVFDQLNVEKSAKVLFLIQSWDFVDSPDIHSWIMQAWTLSVELAFYLLSPLFFILINKSTYWIDAIIVSLLIFCILFFNTSMCIPGVPIPSTLLTHIPLPVLRFPEFLVGIFGCSFFIKKGQYWKIKTFFNTILLTLVILFILFLACTINQTTANQTGFITISMFFLIYLLSANQSIYSSILQHKSLLLLGNASFAIYILQAPIRNYYNYLHLPSYMIFAYPLVLILFSILIYLKLEYPVNKKALAFISTFNSH